MVDDRRLGRRPVVVDGADTQAAFECCPGAHLAHDAHRVDGAAITPDGPWGTVLELWEGYATDPDVRRLASSGGAATALALYAMEGEGMHGTLHIAARPDQPLLNHTVLSRTRSELLAATGSRYAPASPADGLGLVAAAPGPCVFIGKPCDVAAVRKVRAQNPALDRRIGLTVAVFCAGTPSLDGTMEMLEVMGVTTIGDIADVRYRGNGWPGDATVTMRDGTQHSLSYEESWGAILQRHRPWRCHVCADHTGEFADIAVGDPWYREREVEDPGRSLLLARTPLGRDLLHRAMAAGVLELEAVPAGILDASQPNLLRTRGAVWGRIQASRLAGIAAPRYERMPMAPTWRQLGPKAQAQSILGTL
jgi:coenzyme F420 hydrogenase subunit beta